MHFAVFIVVLVVTLVAIGVWASWAYKGRLWTFLSDFIVGLLT